MRPGSAARILLVGMVYFSLTATTHAHLVTTGFGPFYDGISHLFLTPEDFLAVLAIALLSGLGGPRCGRYVLFALPLAWLSGGLAGLESSGQFSLPILTSLWVVVLGGLVAAKLRLPVFLVTGLACLLGLLNGYLNGSSIDQPGVLGLLGITTSIFVSIALVGGPGGVFAFRLEQDRRAGGRKLDWSDRFAHAGVGFSWKWLRPLHVPTFQCSNAGPDLQ